MYLQIPNTYNDCSNDTHTCTHPNTNTDKHTHTHRHTQIQKHNNTKNHTYKRKQIQKHTNAKTDKQTRQHKTTATQRESSAVPWRASSRWCTTRLSWGSTSSSGCKEHSKQSRTRNNNKINARRHCVPTAPTTSIREAQTTTNRYRPVHVGGPGVDELLHHRESHRREAVTCAAPLQVRTRRDPVDLSAHRVVTFRYLCVCGRAVQLLIGRTGGVSVYIFVISV